MKGLTVAFPRPFAKNGPHEDLRYTIQNSINVCVLGAYRTSYREHSPVRTAQPAAAASEMLWPPKPGKKEPPITAIGVNPYKSLNSPANEVLKRKT